MSRRANQQTSKYIMMKSFALHLIALTMMLVSQSTRRRIKRFNSLNNMKRRLRI